MDTSSDFFKTWLKTQENLTENWISNTKRIQQEYMGGTGESSSSDAFNLYNSWTTALFNSLNEPGGASNDILKETLSKVFSSSNAYVKLYEVWLPIFKAIQEKTFTADSFKDLSDPAKYKDILDKVWGFNPEAITEFYGQATRLMEMMGRSSGEFVKPWSDAMQKNLQASPQFVEGHPEAFMNIFHNMFRAFDSTVGNVFHVPAVGKDREKIELLMRGFDDLSVYMAKNTEYQHMMYTTGQKAMGKVIESFAQKIKDGAEIKNFNEFFNQWIDVNERTYYELFQQEEFSKLQGELLDSSLNVRKHSFKLMELHLYDFPIALRSEMDDLYKTVYELKKKVKSLEKQVKKSSGQEEKV